MEGGENSWQVTKVPDLAAATLARAKHSSIFVTLGGNNYAQYLRYRL